MALVAALVGAVGCSAGPTSNGGSGGSGTGGSGGGGRDAGSGGGAGGSSASGGSTGGSGSGTGGTVGTGGSGGASGGAGGGAGSGTGGSGVSDAGATGGTGGSGGQDASGSDSTSNPPPSCSVTLAPLAPQRWVNLAAAEGSKLRVGATATGSQVPAKPGFDWRIIDSGGQTVGTTVVGGDPAVVEFETKVVGQYQITVTVAGITPACTTTMVASAQSPNNLVALYRIRAIAPAGRSLATLETDLPVSVGAMPRKTLELTGGRAITFAAVDERQFELPAYFVQLRSRTSTARVETFVDNTVPLVFPSSGFRTLVDERRQVYDLLVIPAPGTSAGVRAPRLYPGLVPDQFQLLDKVILPGTRVAGTISAAGTPLRLARVRLRDGLLTSTIGDSASNGGYELRVRGGRFEVRVVPPPGSGLPEALLPESAGIPIGEGAPDVALDFQYAALPTSKLDVTVNTTAGAPVGKQVEVLVQSLEGELPNVGSFAFAGSAVPAAGSMRLQRTTMGAIASFAKLPRARYRVTVAPPEDLGGDVGITSEEVDLRAAGDTVARTITLKARTPVPGKLTATTPIAGLRIRASDAGEDGFRRTAIVNVAADGTYTIPADADRLYRLSVEPTVDRSVPRIPLIPIRGQAAQPANTQALPNILTVKGQALGNGMPIPGVVIQIYCLGNAPDCVAEESPDVSNTLPIDETVSGADGSYELRIPEPN